MTSHPGSMSVSLSVKGKPSAFDLSPSNDIAVVASPGCLTLFSLNGLGAPRHVIRYEHPQPIREIKYQKEGKLAALRGGVVSFWDPLHSLRPLLGVVQSSGWIADMDWSTGNANIIATACGQGDIRIYDIRSPASSVLSVSIAGSCGNVSWCPCKPNLLAANDQDHAFVWDTRMVPIQSSSGALESASLGGGATETGTKEVCNMAPDGGVQHMAWAYSETACLVTVSPGGVVTWWDGLTGNTETSCTFPALNADSLVLPSPIGKGLLTTHNEDPANPTLMTSTSALAGSPVPALSPLELSEPHQKLRSLSSTLNRMDHAKFHPTSVWINGYPKKEFSLMSLYNPKGPDLSSASSADRVKTSRQQMAVCPESILGMKWGTPGRLLPLMNGGQELVILSADTATLHAVALPPEAVNKYCDDGSLARSRAARQQQQHHTYHDGTASHKDFKTSLKMNPPNYSISGLKRSLLSPSALLGSKNVVADDTTHNPQSRSGFWGQLQHEILILEEALQKGNLGGLSVGRIDQYARQITLEMTKPFLPDQSTRSIAPSSDASTDEKLDGMERTNEKDIQVAVSWPESNSGILPDSTDDFEKSQVAILIVSFPPKFPVRGLPTFTVRSLLDTRVEKNVVTVATLETELLSVAKSSLSKSGGKAPSLINTQLDAGSRPMSGFLLETARCFRNRALQVWGAPVMPVDSSRSILATPMSIEFDDSGVSADGVRDYEGMDMSEHGRQDVADDHADTAHGADDEHSHDVIDPLAYKVPCPVSSGGIFSTMGNLACFGGSKLNFSVIVTSSKFPNKSVAAAAGGREETKEVHAGGAAVGGGGGGGLLDASNHLDDDDDAESGIVYPKTYADLLLRLREARQLELSSKSENPLREKGDDGGNDGIPGMEVNARLGRGLNSGPFFEQFFQRRDDVDSVEDGSDYGDETDSKSTTDDDLSGGGQSLHDNEGTGGIEANKTKSGNVVNLTLSGVLKEDSSSRLNVISPTSYNVPTRSFVEDLNVLGEEIDRNQELGGFRPSSYRMSGVPLPPGVAGPLNFHRQVPSYVATSSKSSHVMIFAIYGDKRQKLAREYSFGVSRDFGASSTTHSIPTLTRSGGSDPIITDLNKPAVDLGLRSGSMNNLLQAHGALSQYKIGVMDDSNSSMHMISVDDHNFPATSRYGQNVHKVESFSGRGSSFLDNSGDAQSSSQNRGEKSATKSQHSIRNGVDIARTCRYNAALAATSIRDDSLANMWLLLGVCFDMLVTTGFLEESEPHSNDGNGMGARGSTSNRDMISCRRMVISGLTRGWNSHALGRPLLSRVFSHLGRVGDLQTIATITCICGGARAAAFLLGETTVYTSLSLDRILIRYADILHRWECHVQATEVSKYVSRTVSSMVHLSGVEGLSNSSLVSLRMELHCAKCGREVAPWDSSSGVTKKGPWCSFCSGFALQCCLCEQVVRGYGYFCPQCGHGGHPDHIKKWFEVNSECPSGCGCRCGDLGVTQYDNEGCGGGNGTGGTTNFAHSKLSKTGGRLGLQGGVSNGAHHAKSDSTRTEADSDESDNDDSNDDEDDDEEDDDEDEEGYS